jgi:hypothetical protein
MKKKMPKKEVKVQKLDLSEDFARIISENYDLLKEFGKN